VIAETLLLSFWVQGVALEEGHGRFDSLAYNRKEDARGAWQVRPIMVNEVKRLTGRKYSHDRMHDRYYARLFVESYFKAQRARGLEFHEIARRWNGRGKAAESYALRVEMRVLNMMIQHLGQNAQTCGGFDPARAVADTRRARM
jgi:hypothetical protein